MPLFPEIHPLHESQADILRPSDARRGLENNSYEDKWTLGIPVAITNTPKFVGKNREEAAADFTGGNEIAGGGKLNNAKPMALPSDVVGNGVVEVGAVVVVCMVSKDSIE